MAATPDGGGYWLVGSDGGVFGFGDAAYHGSVPGSHSIHLGAPIVGIATRDAGGYWLVGSDGGVFGFGDAAYHGSVPGSHAIHLGAPIVGMAATPDGGGYWLVGSDGGVFGFGDAAYHGSVPGNHSIHLAQPIVGIAADAKGGAGYWLASGQAACLPANCIAQGPVLALGSTGPAVLALQERLIASAIGWDRPTARLATARSRPSMPSRKQRASAVMESSGPQPGLLCRKEWSPTQGAPPATSSRSTSRTTW